MPFFGVWILIVTAAVSAARLEVKVNPRVALSHVGDRLVAECEAQCAENAKFLWDTLSDVPLEGRVTRGESAKSFLTFDPVTIENEETFVCKVTCGKDWRQSRIKVTVYSFPKDPVISGNENLVAGENASITCKVTDVYPPESLRIEWLRNGQVVSKDDSEGGDSRSVQTVSSTYTFMPKAEDNGQAISCRATLQLSGLPDRNKTRESTLPLAVQSPPSKTTVSVNPAEEPKEGECVTISCQSDGAPACNMILRRQTNGQYTELQSSVGSNLSYTIPSIQLEDTGLYECEALNEHGRQNHTVQVMVKASPRNTTVQVSPSWNVPQGRNITVSCTTVSFPAATAVLRRLSDSKELSSSDCVFHLLNLTTSDAGPYLLNVSNALGYEIKFFNLSIMAPPSKITVSVNPAEEPEEGEYVTISCQSDGVPACNMTLRRQTNGQYTELQSSVGSNLSYTIPSIQLEDTGLYECEALNEHGRQNHTVQVMVKASPRNTTVQVSPSWNVPQGRNITVSCTTVSFPAATAVLRRLSDSKELSSSDCVFHLLNLTTSDAGPYLLNVSNALGHEIKFFNLSIMAPPSKITVSVNPAEEPEEGEYVTISCQSDGVPACNMTLRRQTNGQYTELQSSVGSNLSYTIPSIQLEDTGLYECEALNEHGRQNHTVQVMVKASPRNTTVQVSPSWNVPQGRNITVSCTTVSFPAATAVLRRLSDSKELSSSDCVFHLLNLTTSDAGPYLLNVSNALGYEIKFFNLSIMAPPSKITVSVNPAEEPEEGEYVTISCQSDGVPACNMTLRRQTNGQYTELQSSVGSNLSYTIPSIQLEDTGLYECEALNEHGRQNHTVQVMVKASPRNTTVQVSPSWNVPQGRNITVSCTTVSFPAATAVLRRLSDSKELSSSDCVFHLLNLTTSDAGPYLLNVSNALGHEIKFFNLSIMAPPSKITVSVNPAEEPEEGEYVTISCQSDGVPACNMTLRRQTNGQYTELQSSVGSNLSYTIPSIQLEDTGLYECEALNEHGRQNHTVQVMVKASPRNTTVQVSPSWNVPQGRNITVSCTTVSFPAATAVLRRLSDSKELSSSDCVFHLLNLTTSDAGPYLLNVSNALGYEIKFFNLSIMAPPSKITVSVNPAEEPEEGEYVTISCQSDGVPACNMTLRRQTNGQYTELQSSVGSNLSYTIPSIQLEDTGLYECEALNEHGRQNHTVQVMVKASPRNTTVQVSPSWNVPQGRNITVSCTTVSFPAATAVLRRLSDSKELSSSDCVFHLLNLTTSDAGPYLLNVSNALGHEIKFFNLSIMAHTGESPALNMTVPTVATVSLLPAIALVVHYLRKFSRTFSYKVGPSSVV